MLLAFSFFLRKKKSRLAAIFRLFKFLFFKKGGKGFHSAKTNRPSAGLAFVLNILTQAKKPTVLAFACWVFSF